MTPQNFDPFDRRLAPELFDRRFEDLFALGRSQLPRLAPEWTDHNRHDPGITLMELLAWVAEAQLYSLARMRRDERASYAELLGLQPTGPRPASGLLWPLAPHAGSLKQSVVIETDTPVRLEGSEEAQFRPTQRMLWIAGRITALRARLAGGGGRDHTRANEREAPFLPFGETAGPRDVLELRFECASDAGLFPPQRTTAKDARMILGVRAEGELAAPDAVWDRGTGLEVTLLADGERFSLPVLADASRGFMRTGEIVLDLSAVRGSPRAFTLELRAPLAFERPPRLRALAMNVLPILQGERVERELHLSSGLPDQAIALARPGVCFGPGFEPVKVEVDDPAPFALWQPRADLRECGPGEHVYEQDAAGQIRFGNGINGAAPAPDTQIFVSYQRCDGEAGNVARNRRWLVRGIAGIFGVNRDPVAGGAGVTGLAEQRREARRRSKDDHPLVTGADIENGARSLPGLEVARTWIAPPRKGVHERNTVTLVAMRARPDGIEPDVSPETPRWLAAIQRRLAPRMPLGTRLVVAAPIYVGFRLQATLEIEPALDPTAVEQRAWRNLRRRLALVDSTDGTAGRELGLELSARDMVAWLLQTPGVRRVRDARIVLANGKPAEGDWLPRRGLPKLDASRSAITVVNHRAVSA